MGEEYQIVEQRVINKLEELKHTHGGNEYWLAREIQPILGYMEWRNFRYAIKRAKESCATFGGTIINHFVDINKMVAIGDGASRRVKDIILSRYACYLIAMCGDPTKPEIAWAQAYFAVQTHRQELFDQLTEAQKRLVLRERVRDANRHLGDVANQAGVQAWGQFHNAGYRGLYGLGKREIMEKKGISPDEDLLDCVNRMELAENEFRITQTESKLIRDKVQGDVPARQTHFTVGRKIRNIIEDIGGTMPEDLPREPSIKKLKLSKPPKELPASQQKGEGK